MKLAFTILSFVLIAAVLSYGILQTIQGKPAVLIVGTLGYIAALTAFGCLPKKSH